MKKVVLITCTRIKNMEDFKNRPIFKSIEKLTNLYSLKEFDFKICSDNKTGLSEVYNSFINNKEHVNDILLFVHDDVTIKDLFLVEISCYFDESFNRLFTTFKNTLLMLEIKAEIKDNILKPNSPYIKEESSIADKMSNYYNENQNNNYVNGNQYNNYPPTFMQEAPNKYQNQSF
jgi:hypothetical protein